MRHAVLDRLAHHGGDARNVLEHVVDRRPQRRLVVCGIDGDVDLRRAHRFGVLVAFGAARAPGDASSPLELDEATLDRRREAIALLERGSRWSHQKDREGALVEGGQEGRSEGRCQCDRARRKHARTTQDQAPSTERRSKHRGVHGLQATHQPAVAVPVVQTRGGPLEAAPEQQVAECRRHRQRHRERRDDRDDVRHPKRTEEATLDAREEEQRHEHHADHDRREHHRRPDLVARRTDDLGDRSTLVGGPTRVLAQASQHVLDVDDGVVDQFADGDRKAAERHHVDGQAERPQDQQGHRDRQRQGRQGHQRRPGVDEEQGQDHRDDHRGLEQDLQDVVDRTLDEAARPEGVPIEHHARRHRRLDLIEDLVDSAGQFEGVGARGLLDADHDRGAATIRGGAPLRRTGQPHLGDVADRHRSARVHRHDGPLDVRDLANPSHLSNGHLQAVHVLEVARARGGMGSSGGLDHIGDREAEERQAILIDVHAVLGKFTADRDHLGDAWDRQHRVGEVELGEGAKLQRRHHAVGRGERQQHHLAGDARHRGDLGMDALGQALVHVRQTLRHHLAGPVEILAPVELRPDDREARRARRSDLAKSRQAVDGGLDRKRDERLHLVGGKPPRLGHDDHRRGVQFREDVDGHLAQAQAREGRQQARDHHDQRGVTHRELDETREHQWSSAWKVPSAWKCPPFGMLPLIAIINW